MARRTPTDEAYGELQAAYDFYNRELYNGILPQCLLTLQRHKRYYGYFSPGRFKRRAGDRHTDEIAMNPTYMASGSVEEVLMLLVHEMSHLWQAHNGKPGRRGYHNKAWGAHLKTVGLHPSNTGKPGGKETGEQMMHYKIPGGPFDVATRKLLATGFAVSWGDAVQEAKQPPEGEGKEEAPKKDKSLRYKYRCPSCSNNAWGKRNLALVCGKCRVDYELV